MLNKFHMRMRYYVCDTSNHTKHNPWTIINMILVLNRL